MVLTVPEQLRIHFYRNRQDGKLLSELMRSGYECLEDVVSKAVRQKVKEPLKAKTLVQEMMEEVPFGPRRRNTVTFSIVDARYGLTRRSSISSLAMPNSKEEK
jgi:hypothetical protein